MKKVLLIIIDALTSRVVESELKKGTLPTMQLLIDAGEWRSQCTAIFPSLTLAATPSIATGRYPHHHGMIGAYWFNQPENRIVYFGADPWIVIRQGPGEFLKDFLVRLNDRWLSSDTVFEYVERQGRTAASLNWFMYRGLTQHTIDMKLLGLVPNAPASTQIYGPSTLHLGDFVNSTATTSTLDSEVTGHPFNRFGFKDEITGKLLLRLAEQKAFSDFTLAYFPENDFKSHEVGPENAVETLHKVDAYLADMIDAYGGLESFLADFVIMISGDHSQSDIVDDEDQAAIDLAEILNEFNVSKVGKGWDEDEEIILCPNGRAATIYLRNRLSAQVDHITRELLQDERINQVIYRGPDSMFNVVTSDRGHLRFKPVSSAQDATGHDCYGGQWQWQGDLTVFGENDIQEGEITFGEYPNAFERIALLLNAQHSGDLWMTAHTGYDFIIPGAEEAHPGGGSHGALDYLDSSPPLIIAGHPDDLTLPDVPRSVDLVPLALEILNIPNTLLKPGESHMMEVLSR